MSIASSLKKNFPIRILKAGVKAALVYVAYCITTFLITFLIQSHEQVGQIVGEFMPLIDVFFIAIIVFTFLGELFSDTLIKYVLEVSRALFVIFYFLVALEGGIIERNIASIHVAVNLQFFLLMIALINVVRIAKSVLSAINFLHEKSEGKQ